MSFNLNTATGLAQATLSSAATALSNLLGLSQWDIQESAYQAASSTSPVLFHVFKSSEDFSAAVDNVQDTFSRRVPEYKFPYVDGQATDDLGKEASEYVFDAVLFGPYYLSALRDLIVEVNKPVNGTLTHPVYGPITVKFKSLTVMHKSRERQAATLRLVFVDSALNVSFTNSAPTVKSALAKAASFISSVSTAIVQAEGYAAIATSALLGVNSLVDSFSSLYTNFLVSLNVSFNSGTSADLPGLLPASTAAAFSVATATTGIYAGSTPAQVQAH